MWAKHGLTEEEVRFIQHLMPDATLEQMDAFKKCMQTDAVYKAAIPYGLAATIGVGYMLPKKLGMARSVFSIGIGLMTYITAKIMYTPICSKLAFGLPMVNEASRRRRGRFAINTDRNDSFDREDNQSEYDVPLNNWSDAESEWKTFDSRFDNDTNVFDDTINQLEGDETNVEKENIEKRVTYDDLWVQYRNEEMQRQHRDRLSYKSGIGVGARSKQEEKMGEGSEIYEAEIEEERI